MSDWRCAENIRRFIGLLLMTIMVVGGGCRKNEVKVELALPQGVTDAYGLIYYSSDATKGGYVENVAAVQGGKGEMTLPTRNPVIVLFLGQGSLPRAGFYAVRGDKIKITGKDSDPYSWTIRGNKLTEEWNGWCLKNAAALKQRDTKKINGAVSAFVKENPEAPLSTILLLIYFNRREDEAGFKKNWKLLKGEALHPKWLRLIGRSDMIEEAPLFRESVERLIVTSVGNGVDTISFKGKPLMIYFWREEDDRRQEDMERYAKTTREFSDSSKRLLADISFDPDSATWSFRERRDSVEKAIRGWIFRAEGDSVISRMKVRTTPWFVVVAPDGKYLYEGMEGVKADSLFRSLMK